MKNWQKYLLICIFASLSSCATNQQTYQTRGQMGKFQTQTSINDEYRRANDTQLNSTIERANWDNW